MKRSILMILIDIVVDAFLAVKCFIKDNLRVFAGALELLLPYVMYFVGQYVCKKFGYLKTGAEIIIPICFIVVIYLLRSIANRIGKGLTIPVPNKRFTEVDEDGEVTMENDRVPELLLYTADLEDWFERRGLL